MFTRSTLTALICLLAQAVAGETTPEINVDAVEPPLVYTLTIDGQHHAVTEGVAVQLNGAFTNPEVSLTPSAYRVFRRGGVKSPYPATFTFAADLVDDAARSWTLSGGDATLMWFDLAGDLTATDMAVAMAEQFGANNCRQTDTRLTLGKTIYAGRSIDVCLVGQRLSIVLCSVSHSDGRTRLLVLQDVLDDTGRHSSEYQDLCQLLKSAFTIARRGR